MNKVLVVGGAVVAAVAVSMLMVGGRDITGHGNEAGQAGTQHSGLPWQVETLPGGAIKVMGLTLAAQTTPSLADAASPASASAPAPAPHAGSTLADAQLRWSETMQVAIIAAPGEDGTLEAFVDPAQAGFITGKLVITAHLPPADIKAMRERAVKAEFMESTTRKYVLAPADMAAALRAPISALSFIPQANLDENTVLARFGQPAERVRSNGHLQHYLYPAKGLDLALDTEGKELLQYVAPAAFGKLVQPLKQARPQPATASTAVASAAQP
jgi:hypothetical protein